MLMVLQNHPLLKAELERARKNEPLPALDTHRYQLPAPTSTPGSDEEWQAALDNARAQLQHQRLRWVYSVELQILHTYSDAQPIQPRAPANIRSKCIPDKQLPTRGDDKTSREGVGESEAVDSRGQ